MALNFSDVLLHLAGGAAGQYNINVETERKLKAEKAKEARQEALEKRIATFNSDIRAKEATTANARAVEAAKVSREFQAGQQEAGFKQQMALQKDSQAFTERNNVLKREQQIQDAAVKTLNQITLEQGKTKIAKQNKTYEQAKLEQDVWAANESKGKGAQVLALAEARGNRDKLKRHFDQGGTVANLPAMFTTPTVLPENPYSSFSVDTKTGRVTLDEPTKDSADYQKQLLEQRQRLGDIRVSGEPVLIPEDTESVDPALESMLNTMFTKDRSKPTDVRWEVTDSNQVIANYMVDGVPKSEIITPDNYDQLKPASDDIKVSFQDLVDEDGSTESVAVSYRITPNGAEIIKKEPIGESVRMDKKTRKWNQAAKKEVSAAGDVRMITERMKEFVDARQSGLGGAAINTYGFFKDLQESITGVRGESDITTLAAHMSAGATPEARQELNTFLRRRMAQGTEQVLETMLKYRVALMDKPSGKLNVDDMVRVDNMLGKGIRGGAAYASAITSINDMARSLGRARIKEIIDRDDSIKGFTGKVRYSPRHQRWMYQTKNSDGSLKHDNIFNL